MANIGFFRNEIKNGPSQNELRGQVGADYAWRNHLPCLNPYCKSHGKPHPNCMCYEQMAEGGEAGHFCSTANKHKPGCEYFADGGEALPDFDSLQEDAPAPGATPNFDDMQDDSEKYGSTGQQFLTGVEGVAQGYAGPLATAAELGLSKLGVPGISAQDIAAREAANPTIHGIGEMAGLGAGLMSGTGEAGLIANLGERVAPKAFGKIGSAIIKNGVYGALSQGGDEISKAMLGQGDPNAPVSSALANMGAAGVFGGLLGGGSAALGKVAGWTGTKAAKLLNIDPELQLGTTLQNYLSGFGYANAKAEAKKTGTKIGTEEFQKAYSAADAADEKGFSQATSQYNNAVTPEGMDTKAFKRGQQTHSIINQMIAPTSAVGGAGLGARYGYDQDGISGALTGGLKGLLEGYGGAQGVKYLGKYGTPAIMKVLSDSEGKVLPNVGRIFDYTKNIDDGAQKISNGINNIFTQPTIQQVNKNDSFEKLKGLVKDYIGNGGINQNIQEQQYQNNQNPIATPMPQFAEGGEVETDSLESLEKRRTDLKKQFEKLHGEGKHDEADKIDDELEDVRTKVNKFHDMKKILSKVEPQEEIPMQQGKVAPLLNHEDPIAKHFPEQNMLLQSAKARISNHLSSMQPSQFQPQMPFDRKPDQSQQEKQYDKVVGMAVDPISIFQKIHSGQLTQDDMNHFTAMYPELHEHLKKKFTERIIQAQINGEKPPAHVRQALSLFMGAPMESVHSQPMLAAAQATFAGHKPQQQDAPKPATKNKKNTSSLGKVSEQYQTAAEASAMRGQETK